MRVPFNSLAMNSLDQFFHLSPTDRAAHYRQLADEMRSRAQSTASGQTRIGYLNMADEWLYLAEKLEAEYGKVSVIVESELASLLKQQGPF